MENQTKKVEIIIKWRGYNARRFGRPWIARITQFPGSAQLDFIRYAYNGDENGGELVAEMEIGEVFKYGQKDNRGNGTVNRFAVVLGDGDWIDVDTAAEARHLWKAWQEGRDGNV